MKVTNLYIYRYRRQVGGRPLTRWAITITLFFCCLTASVMAQPASVIKAADYHIRPNTGQDLTWAVQQLVDRCKLIIAEKRMPVILKFEPGQYDFYFNRATRATYYISNTSGKEEIDSKEKTIAILLKDINGLTIDGGNALFMLHGKMTALIADNCNDLKIQNLQFDYARPTMSEFTVVAVNNQYIDVRVNPDSWYRIKEGMLYWYGENWDQEKVVLRLHTCVYTPSQNALHFVRGGWDKLTRSKRVVELSKNLVRFYDPGELSAHVGDVYTLRDITRDEVGMHFVHCKNVRMEHVQMHFMHGLGIVSQFCTNIHFDSLRCAPRPETGRICSSTADMAHFSGCNGKITVENSFFSGGHDDPVNIHGTHLRIIRRSAANKLIVRFMHHQSYGFQAYAAGDTVDFVSATTLLPYATRVVQSYKRLDEFEIELTLRGKLPQSVDSLDCLENATRTPSVVIRNNWFERTATRGLLVTTRRKVIIEGNTWYKTGMSAILVADDANNWFESGMVRDLTIRGNRFVVCGLPVINIAPENRQPVPGKSVHQNIRINDNRFEAAGGRVLAARSVDGLWFTGNTIVPAGPGNNHAAGSLLSVHACRHVLTENNIISPRKTEM